MRNYSKIRPSQFIGKNPTQEEILFMYEWLYNYNKKKKDWIRCTELENKYNIIKKSSKVEAYKIEHGIPILAGAVAGEIPNINYKIVNGEKMLITKKQSELNYQELKERAINITEYNREDK